MVKIFHEMHPHKGAKLEIVGIEGKYFSCKYLYGEKSGEIIPLAHTEIQKI